MPCILYTFLILPSAISHILYCFLDFNKELVTYILDCMSIERCSGILKLLFLFQNLLVPWLFSRIMAKEKNEVSRFLAFELHRSFLRNL